MLFALAFAPRSGLSEERDKRMHKLFSNWKPPDGAEFKGLYDYADGNGGIAIVEATSAEVMFETTAPWAAFLEFTIRPLVPAERSTPILAKAYAWRDSIR